MADEARVPISCEGDIVTARRKAREIAAELGFSATDQAVVATAVSELTRNILQYAHTGEVLMSVIHRSAQSGLLVVARDQGPGIPNVELAMEDGYSTSKGLGLGLPGARRLMDEFDILSVVGKGTTVTVRKWRR